MFYFLTEKKIVLRVRISTYLTRNDWIDINSNSIFKLQSIMYKGYSLRLPLNEIETIL